ncbi:MAG: hypothetical protein ACRYFB_15420 [Janthinobacterium lividum]
MGNGKLIFDYKAKQGLLKNKNGIAVLQSLGYRKPPSRMLTGIVSGTRYPKRFMSL